LVRIIAALNYHKARQFKAQSHTDRSGKKSVPTATNAGQEQSCPAIADNPF
jgi:hypothetical protein